MKINNCKNIDRHVQYTIGLSFTMHNLSQQLKRISDKTGNKTRFSRCVTEIRELLDCILQDKPGYCINSHLTRILCTLCRYNNNYCKNLLNCNTTHCKVRGRYKSKTTIEQLNEYDSG